MSKRKRCRYCGKPMATPQDCDEIPAGEGEHLCWDILQGCDQDAEEAIDLRDARIAELERELAQIKAILEDPAEVELAMIRGDIAIPHRVEFDGIRDTPADPPDLSRMIRHVEENPTVIRTRPITSKVTGQTWNIQTLDP